MIFYNYQPADYLFFVSNVAVICCYVSIAITLIFAKRALPVFYGIVSKSTRWVGAAFFVAGAIVRAQLAWHAVIQKPYLNLTNPLGVPFSVNTVHVLNAILVWAFAILLARDFADYGKK